MEGVKTSEGFSHVLCIGQPYASNILEIAGRGNSLTLLPYKPETGPVLIVAQDKPFPGLAHGCFIATADITRAESIYYADKEQFRSIGIDVDSLPDTTQVVYFRNVRRAIEAPYSLEEAGSYRAAQPIEVDYYPSVLSVQPEDVKASPKRRNFLTKFFKSKQ